MSRRTTNTYVDTRAKQCDGKIRWPTKARAKQAQKKHGMQRSHRVYRCPYCGWFHIGTRLTESHWDERS